MTERLPTLTKAAKRLNIGPRILMAELRRRHIIDHENHAPPAYTSNGIFKIELRTHELGKSGAVRGYHVTTVTEFGLRFLQGIANELRGSTGIHGSDGADRATAEREPVPVHGGDRAASVREVRQ